MVVGVNGEWSVVNYENAVAYVRAEALCAPPTRAAVQNTPPSDVAAPTPSAPPLASSASSLFKYPAPQLLVPTNGARYWCARELMFEWGFDAALAPDEFFLIESKLVEHDRWNALADWTREKTVTLFPSKGDGECDTVWWGHTGVYEWRVSVVRGNKEMPTYLSPFSEQYRVNYGN